MEYRRSSHSGERRRRVLIEEAELPLSTAPSNPQSVDSGPNHGSAEPARSYVETALSRHQRRVIDLIPRRRWTVLLLTLLAVTVAAGLEALHGYLALGHTPLQITQVPAVDLTAPGNLADWFSSSLLLAAAGLGVLTYLIRRHRVDDYRGRYRMWCWVVPLLVVASMDQVCDLQGSLRTVLLVVAGIPDYADAAWIWAAVVSVLTVAVVVRLAIEMRACRLAVAALCVVLACFVARQAAALDWVLPARGVLRDMVVAAFVLCGNIHLLLALCLNARHVYRDASGQIVPRTRSARPRVRARRAGRAADPAAPDATSPTVATKASRKATVPQSPVRIDAPHVTAASGTSAQEDRARASREPARGTSASRAAQAAVARPAAASESEPDDDAAGPALSKAERRRQRKLQRRAQRSA